SEDARAKKENKNKAPRGKLSRWILLCVVALAVTGATLWWLHSQNYESTDDAQIEGHLDLVSARISGTVSYINPRVENNQVVEAGDSPNGARSTRLRSRARTRESES